MLDAQIPAETVDAPTIAAWVEDARRTTFALVEGLSDEQLLGPQLEIVNPLLWELGHLAWFQDHFVLRQLAGREPLRGDADALWNSGTVAHDTRWELPLPSRAETLAYMDAVREGVIEEVLARDPRPELLEMALYTVFHEDWHDEAIVYTHQTHGWQAPARLQSRAVGPSAADLAVAGRDVAVPGGVLELGARPRDGFVFDNEKWAHPVEVADFRIARETVTQAEFGAFVKDGGYGDARLWSEDGWRWRRQLAAEHPVYWQRGDGGWLRRSFERWVALEPELPVVNVNWHEAEAFCRWAGRRLPTEAEWELAACGDICAKPRYPWGSKAPEPERANLDLRLPGPLPVGALPDGDSAGGVRQLIGDVWEWTASTFCPYPGFEPDRYGDNSEAWFGSRKVLRGGSFATRSRLVRNTLRNYFTPERRDVWAGFRTCAR